MRSPSTGRWCADQRRRCRRCAAWSSARNPDRSVRLPSRQVSSSSPSRPTTLPARASPVAASTTGSPRVGSNCRNRSGSPSRSTTTPVSETLTQPVARSDSPCTAIRSSQSPSVVVPTNSPGRRTDEHPPPVGRRRRRRRQVGLPALPGRASRGSIRAYTASANSSVATVSRTRSLMRSPTARPARRRGRSALPRRKVATTRDRQPAAGERGVAAAAGQRGRVDRPRCPGVDQAQVGRLADRERTAVAGQPADPRGALGQPVGDLPPAQPAGQHHRLGDDRQRGLQSGHPGLGRTPLGLLVLRRVRRVVGGDAVDGAVGQARAQRLRRRRRSAAAGSP